MRFFSKKPPTLPPDNYYIHGSTSEILRGLATSGWKLRSAIDIVSMEAVAVKAIISEQPPPAPLGEIVGRGYRRATDRCLTCFGQLIPEEMGILYDLNRILLGYCNPSSRPTANLLPTFVDKHSDKQVVPHINILLILMWWYPHESVCPHKLKQIEQKITDTILMCYLLSLLGRRFHLVEQYIQPKEACTGEDNSPLIPRVAETIRKHKCNIQHCALTVAEAMRDPKASNLSNDDVQKIILVFKQLGYSIGEGAKTKHAKGNTEAQNMKSAQEYIYSHFLLGFNINDIFQEILGGDDKINWSDQHAREFLKIGQIYEKRLATLRYLMSKRDAPAVHDKEQVSLSAHAIFGFTKKQREPEEPYPILFLVPHKWHQDQQILFKVKCEYRPRSPLKIGDHIKYIGTDQQHIKTLQDFFDSNGCQVTVVDLEQVKSLEQELKSAYDSTRQ